ncbi:MAG: glycosyltransferase family 4 protein [Acidimicrobiia bacterium]|nr:glycosyltransferase family 4 protein [Acidimicrobiia bacterium]
MKVGLVCPYDLAIPGGVQDQVIRLSRWLRDAGHEAVIVAPGDSSVPGFVSAGPATVIPANGAATPVALQPGAGARVLETLREVDVAHIHEPLMPQVSLTALRRSPVPAIGTFHADPSTPAAWVYRTGRPLTSRWFRRLRVLTAVSPIAARVVDYTGRVRIIPNGIDVDDYTPESKVPQSVVFLGRNDERKGLPVLLAAWPEVRATHPGATLTVVGADQVGPSRKGVSFVGRVSEEEKVRYLAEATIYCAPNLSGESFGIVVAEGMAAGCAVVASGLPAFVRVAGDTASYVAPGDVAGLAGAIRALLSDPEETSRRGVAARRAVRRFDGAVVAAAYIGAYEDARNAS